MPVCDVQSQTQMHLQLHRPHGKQPYQGLQGFPWLLLLLVLLLDPDCHDHPCFLFDQLRLGCLGGKQESHCLCLFPRKVSDEHFTLTRRSGTWHLKFFASSEQVMLSNKGLPGRPWSPFAPFSPGTPKIIKTNKQTNKNMTDIYTFIKAYAN